MLSYTYDLNGNRATMTDVTGKCTGYRYNSLDRLEEIRDNERVLARYQYNGDGTIKSLSVGDSLITEYGYDADKNLISQKTMMFGMEEVSSPLGKLTGLQPQTPVAVSPMKPTVLVDNTYAYDNNANRIEKRTLAGLNRFAYDSANRLVKAEYPTGAAIYRYDKAGNRTGKTWTGADAVTAMEERYHYDSCNRLTSRETMQGDMSQPTQLQYQYDAQGNMLSDGSRQFTYDAMNRLSEVRNEDGSFQKNRYDGEGLRTELEENGRLVSFIFDGDKVVSEKDDENTIRYIRGYELISSDSEKARTYYHYTCDEMGSITHVTDEAGSVLNRYEYDAFGECTYREETVANRFGFAGEQYDPVAGMYYLRARFYNPVIGRFIQEDTYYGDGLNLYAYCHNNPVGYVDPSGHAGEICDAKETALSEIKKNGIGDDAEEIYNNFRDQGLDPEAVKQKVLAWNAYMDDIEKQTGFKLSDLQRRKLIEAMSKDMHSRRLTDAEKAKHRGADWGASRDDLIKEWQRHYKKTWPTYEPGDAERSGYVSHKEGNNYDAHEIIPNVYGGPMEWWNLVPAKKGNEHQGGIHRSGGPIDEFFPKK